MEENTLVSSDKVAGAAALSDLRGSRPGRRGSDYAVHALAELLSRETTRVILGAGASAGGTPADLRYGVAEAERDAPSGGTTPYELELERKLSHLEQAFTQLAKRNAVLEKALAERAPRSGARCR